MTIQVYIIRLAVGGSQICEIPRNTGRILPYSSSRSSTVIDYGVNRNLIYDILLVINSNFGCISSLFEILTFKARKWVVFQPLPYLTPPLGNPLIFLGETYPTRTRGMGLYRKVKMHNPNFNRSRLIHPCNRRTGDNIYRYIMLLSRANKVRCPILGLLVSVFDGKY